MALTGERTLPLVEVSINGHGPARLLVDLGSNVCLLRRDVAERCGAQILVERPTTDVARLDSLRLGDAVFLDVTVAIYDTLDVEGVIGYNLLDEHPFLFDLPNMRIVLHDSLRLDAADPNALPFELIGRMPYVTATAGNDTLQLNFDTGAFEEMTIPLSWKDRFAWFTEPIPGGRTMNNQTGITQVLKGTLADTLALGPHKVAGVKVNLNPDVEDAWLGCGTLQRFALRIDPAAQLTTVSSTDRDH